MKIFVKSILVIVIIQFYSFISEVNADTPPDSTIKLYDQVLQQPGWISSYYVSVDSFMTCVEYTEPDRLITGFDDSSMIFSYYDTTMYDTMSTYAKLELLNDSVGIFGGLYGIDTIDFVLVSQDEVLPGNGVFMKIVSANKIQLIFLDEHVDYIIPFVSYCNSTSLGVSLDEINEALLDGKWQFHNGSAKNYMDFREKSVLRFHNDSTKERQIRWELRVFDEQFILMLEDILYYTVFFEIKEFSKSRMTLINIRSKQKVYLIKDSDE